MASNLLNLKDGSKITVAELAEKLKQGLKIQFWVGDNGYDICGHHYRAPMLTLWPGNAYDLTERDGLITYTTELPTSALKKIPPEYEADARDHDPIIPVEVQFKAEHVHWVDILA